MDRPASQITLKARHGRPPSENDYGKEYCKTASGQSHLAALTGGYHISFLLGAIFALSAAAIGITFMRVSGAEAGAHGAAPELAAEGS